MNGTGKKVVSMILTLLVISVLVFLAFSVIPGDPASSILGTQATPAKLEALRETMGLNQPLPLRYGKWLIQLLQGDMGTSYSYQIPVTSMIADKIPVTLTLTLFSFVMMISISIPLSIYTAKHEGSRIDQIIFILNQIMMAIPPFFSGILITLLFGAVLHWFTPGGYVSYQSSLTGFLGYLIFPAFAIALPKAAMAVKLLRSSLIGEAKMDYVRTAYSRGNRTKDVFYHHMFKNAVIPVITFWGMTLADMIAGSIIIEQVFSIPGLGRILISSIANRDYPVVQAIIICIAGIIIIVNFLVDLIYKWIDPRITLE